MPTDASQKMNPLALERFQLAEVLSRTGQVSLTPSAINNWVNSGCPRNPDKTYNLVYVTAWLAAQYGKGPHIPRPETEDEKAARIALLNERRLGAQQKRRIEARKLEEGFLPRAEVDAEFGRMATEIRSTFLGLPARLAKALDGKSEVERAALLDAEVRAALETLANGKEDDHVPER